MALDIAFYKVTEDIAKRSGLILERYRTKDMHWILDNKDLGRVRFTSDEYIYSDVDLSPSEYLSPMSFA